MKFPSCSVRGISSRNRRRGSSAFNRGELVGWVCNPPSSAAGYKPALHIGPVLVINGRSSATTVKYGATGAGGLLKISFVAYALWWLLLSFVSTPLCALLVQLLHGLSFAAFLVGGITYINKLAPEGLSTTAHAIFNSAPFGLGSIMGSLVAGYFYDTWGMAAMFRVLCLIALIGLFVFHLSGKLRRRQIRLRFRLEADRGLERDISGKTSYSEEG